MRPSRAVSAAVAGRLRGGSSDRRARSSRRTTGATPQLLRELEDFSLVSAVEGRFRPEDEQIVSAAVGLSRFGVGARHLRTIHSSIQREAGLIEQLLAPSLRSRNPERQSAGLEDLETLAGLCADLTEAVLMRDLGNVAR